MSTTETLFSQEILSVQPIVERESSWLAKRYGVSHLSGDIMNEVNVKLLEKFEGAQPEDVREFATRQEIGEGYEVREAARNAVRRLKRQSSKQVIAFESIEEPVMPEDASRRLAELQGEVDAELEKSYGNLSTNERNALQQEVARHIDIEDSNTPRTASERAMLKRARGKMNTDPAAMLARLGLAILLCCGAVLAGSNPPAKSFKLDEHQSTAFEHHQCFTGEHHQCFSSKHQ